MPLTILENVPLSPLSTIGVGGAARYFTRATTEAEVVEACDWAQSRAQEVLVLGGGSNLVVADAGFPGLVVQVAIAGRAHEEADGAVTLTAGAGEVWDDVVAYAVSEGWAGFECLSGIPGFVGATPLQNVGAYGQEVADTIVSVAALELGSGRRVSFDNAACRFRYRESRFKDEDRGRYVIVSVRYRLRAGGAPAVKYPDLQKALAAAGRDREPTLADVRAAVIAVRRQKSMVLDPNDICSRSVGSFFMNPIVEPARAEAAEAELRRRGHLANGAALPRYPAGPERVKLPAAWLIEHCGLARGTRRGAVGLSERHTLAIVNYGGASAADVVGFAREVRDRVHEGCGIRLSPEPVLVGLTLDGPGDRAESFFPARG